MKPESQEALLVLLKEFGEFITHHSQEVITLDENKKIKDAPLINFLNELSPKDLGYVFLGIQNLGAIMSWCPVESEQGDLKTAIHAANMFQQWIHMGAESFLKEGLIEGPRNTQELILFVLDSCHISPTLNQYVDEIKKEKANDFFKNFDSTIVN